MRPPSALLLLLCASASVPAQEKAHLVEELNALRSDPRAYARKIEARLRYYDGRRLKLPGQITIVTTEGIGAAREAMGELIETSPVRTVSPSNALARSAFDHAADLGSSGEMSHRGSDGSTPSMRMQRYLPQVRSTAEVITFGPADAESVLIDLLVDDGVRDRGHRRILLDSRYTIAGAGCAPHRSFGTVCVIDLASTTATSTRQRRSR